MSRSRYSQPAGAAILVIAALICAPRLPAAAGAPPGVKDGAQHAVDKGLAYLRQVQETDGSWSHYPGTTALAVAAFLRNGHTELKDPAVSRGVQFILASVKPNGAIYSDANPATALPNYNTSLCLMALSLTHNAGYRTIITRAQNYLEHSQFDEEGGIAPSNPAYGGIGYGSHPDRPDLSNLQMALESLKDSGVPGSAPVWKHAIVFLQRVQNRKESNDQAWAKEGSDDGGFLYAPTGKSYSSEGAHASYGSMSYAGLKSYIYCGVSRDDPRAVAAWNWIRGHYTVTEHPGMGDTSLYYYYHTMAKTLDVFGRKLVVDTHGASHDWSQDLANQIVSTQHPDGSWFNSNPRYWEDQPALVTSYSLIALSYCLRHA